MATRAPADHSAAAPPEGRLAWAEEQAPQGREAEPDAAPGDDATAPPVRPSTYAPRRRARREEVPPAPPTAPPPAPPAQHAPSPPPATPPPRGILRGALRVLSVVVLISGVLLVADAIATVTWQEPITGVLAQQKQARLGTQLRRLEATGPTVLEQRALAQITSQSRRLAFRSRSLKRRADDGAAVARIRIPRIGADDVVVMGTDEGDLKKGPGFYASNPLPGAPGTVAIAGHRTTYGAPFRHVDKLRRGDRITVQMPYATFTYVVERTRIVKPSEVSVLQRRRTSRLVLTACHPLFSAAERMVISARLERTRPRGSARTTTST